MVSSGERAVFCGERGCLPARTAAEPIQKAAELYGIRVRQLRADMLFDDSGIGAPHLLLQFTPGFGDLDELAALVHLAFAARRQALVDQPVDQPRRGILR